MKYEDLGYPEKFEKNPVGDLVFENVKKGPVLDVGCGNGNILSILKRNFDVEGFDISKFAVGLAKKRDLNVRVSSIEDFKPKRKFGTILLIGMVVLSENPSRLLKRVSGWLDSQGVIMLTVPNSISPKRLLGISKRNKYNLYFPSFFQFRKLLRNSGFKIIKCAGAGKLRGFPILSSVIFYIIRPVKD